MPDLNQNDIAALKALSDGQPRVIAVTTARRLVAAGLAQANGGPAGKGYASLMATTDGFAWLEAPRQDVLPLPDPQPDRVVLELKEQFAINELLGSLLVGPDADGLWEYAHGWTDTRVAREAVDKGMAVACTPSNVKHVRLQMFGNLRPPPPLAVDARIAALEERVAGMEKWEDVTFGAIKKLTERLEKLEAKETTDA